MSTPGYVVTDDARPEAPKYGLISPAVKVIYDSDPHWQNGLYHEMPENATTVTLHSLCDSSVSASVTGPKGDPYSRYTPFLVRAEYACSTMGRKPEEIEEIVKTGIQIGLAKAIEQEFWEGSLSPVQVVGNDTFATRYLASTGATNVTPTPGTGVRPSAALALLENAMGAHGLGNLGNIHVPVGVLTALAPRGLPRDDAGSYVTPAGSRVVAGSGYDGSIGPGGSTTPAGSVWLYATGPVTVRLSDRFIVPEEAGQAIDRNVNTTTYYAQQVAAVTWSTDQHFAVLVNLVA